MMGEGRGEGLVVRLRDIGKVDLPWGALRWVDQGHPPFLFAQRVGEAGSRLLYVLQGCRAGEGDAGLANQVLWEDPWSQGLGYHVLESR